VAAAHKTAARANELLALDVKGLDLANRRARVHSKGGAVEWVFWQTGSAQLLPRLLVGRTTGPVFLATVVADVTVGANEVLRCRRRRGADLGVVATVHP